jgi:hypothetical protein
MTIHSQPGPNFAEPGDIDDNPMAALDRLLAAAKEFTAAAAIAVDYAVWQILHENNWAGGSPDYPYTPNPDDLEEGWRYHISDDVATILQQIKTTSKTQLKLLKRTKEEPGDDEITGPMVLNPPDPRGINPPNTTRHGPLPKEQALKTIKSLEFLEKLGALIRWEKSKASDGTELWTIYVAPIPEEELTPEQKAAREAGREPAGEPSTSSGAAPPRREDRFKSRGNK